MEESINQSNAAMAAAHAKAAGSSNSQGSKGNNSGKPLKKCKNCNKKGHVESDCFAKGGGKADSPPDWWKERMAKAKQKSDKSANVADKNSNNEDEDNYALVAINAEENTDDDITNVALVITTRHDHHDAHAVSKSVGIIVDCGASSHFSPDRENFINYHQIAPEPVKAADGRLFNATGKGNLQIKLPTRAGHKPVTVTFQGVYYASSLAFT